ncbi:MAG: secondary thiamine-phosphate synthase enzyme YjbQ [Candidatus Nanohaloarchaea archaeon]|nr:secondary thiamine-phosphate synthase enzyme YjbQ [Candidatus Nanohaloarchaea archaeon]
MHHGSITERTPEEGVINVTQQVQDAVKIDDGLCLVFCPHTTAALAINEDESGLKQDMLDRFDDLFPADGDYRHNRGAEDNASSHLTTILAGSDHVIPVEDGKLQLGTWQDILLIETDGPRSRSLEIYCLGE